MPFMKLYLDETISLMEDMDPEVKREYVTAEKGNLKV